MTPFNSVVWLAGVLVCGTLLSGCQKKQNDGNSKRDSSKVTVQSEPGARFADSPGRPSIGKPAVIPDRDWSAIERPAKPNLILINLDDADWQLMSPEILKGHFPNLYRFSRQGIRFTNFHVTTPLCGPSRASLFRGQYAYRTGIRCNDPFAARSNGYKGGMAEYGRQGFHDDDLSTWMKQAGYRTMMVGKYLHGDPVDIVPAGWDDFYSSRGANYFGTVRFTNRESTNGSMHIEDKSTYRTTQECDETIDLIRRHKNRGGDDRSAGPSPFFLYWAPITPHHHTPHDPNGMVDTQYKSLWPNTRMPLNADFLEDDITDKSTAIRDVPMMNPRQKERLKGNFRNRMLAMKSIDDSIQRLFDTLRRQQLLDSTYIFLTSDNGFSNGHHRMVGKGDAFDRSTRVPTFAVGPGIAAMTDCNHLLAHIDLAPTMVDLAGGKVPESVDGKSFARLLTEPNDVPVKSWRTGILIENFERRSLQGREFNTASLAVRMQDSIYVQWADGTPEYYDLKTDPWQIENNVSALSKERRLDYENQIQTLRSKQTRSLATIANPPLGKWQHGRGRPVGGMAECSSGVGHVSVVVKRSSDFHYWNGQTWQASACTNLATLTNPEQIMTAWTFDKMPRHCDAEDVIQLTVAVKGLADGEFGEPVTSLFQLDYSKPKSEIDFPGPTDGVLPQFQIKGMTFDAGGVDHVVVVIRNKETGRYWDGSRWQTPWTKIRLPVRSNGRFGTRYEELVGNFYVSVRAVDTSGNIQSPPFVTTVSVNGERE